MPKRPSASSTRARQKAIIRYLYSTKNDYRLTAKHFQVSPKQLERFTSSNPKKVKGRLSRSPAFQRLYSADVKQVARSHDVDLVPKYSTQRVHALEQRGVPVTEKQRGAIDYYRETRQRVYTTSKTTGQVRYRKPTKSSAEALRNAGYAGYSTTNSVQAGYLSGQLSADDVSTIIDIWRKFYPKSRVDFDALEESILGMEIDVEESPESE